LTRSNKVRVSVNIERDLLEALDRQTADQDGPFYGNRSRAICYYLRKSLPPKGDISVEMGR